MFRDTASHHRMPEPTRIHALLTETQAIAEGLDSCKEAGA